jgi:hypothetical protein
MDCKKKTARDGSNPTKNFEKSKRKWEVLVQIRNIHKNHQQKSLKTITIRNKKHSKQLQTATAVGSLPPLSWGSHSRGLRGVCRH